jgi:hypothetical protein
MLIALAGLAMRVRKTSVTQSADQLRHAWSQLDAVERRIAALEASVIEQSKSRPTTQTSATGCERS